MIDIDKYKLRRYERWLSYLHQWYRKKYQEDLPSVNPDALRAVYESGVSYQECANELYTEAHKE